VSWRTLSPNEPPSAAILTPAVWQLSLRWKSLARIYTLTGMLPPFLGADDKSDPFAKLIFSSSRRILKLTLPGQVLSSNADSREGQTYIWRLDPLATEGRSISARWNASGASDASADPVPARR